VQKIYLGTSANVIDIDFRTDVDRALIITDNSAVYQYSDLGGTEFVVFLGQFSPVTFMAVSWHPTALTALLVGYEIVNTPNGYRFEGRVFQYDENTGQFTNLHPNVPLDRDTDLYSVDWRIQGDFALIGGWVGYVLKWDGTVFGTVSTSTGNTFLGIGFNGQGTGLLVGTGGQAYTYKAGVFQSVVTNTVNTFYCVDWASDSSKAFMAGLVGTLATYDPVKNTVTLLTVGSNTTFYDVAWRPDWSYALVVGARGAVYKWDGSKLTSISSPTTENLLGVAWDPNGDIALIVGTSGTLVEFFDGGAGDPTMTTRLSGSNNNLWDVDFNSNGVALIVGDRGDVRIWSGNFATKVVTTTTNSLRGVHWKDTTTAYIIGDSGTILRFQTSPIQRVDISAPNLGNSNALWGGQWKDDKQRGLICGQNGLLMEQIDNNPRTTLDDTYNVIPTNTNSWLYHMDWNYDETDALMTGDGGKVVNLHDQNNAVRVLQSPTTEILYSVGWKGNQYALIVGTSGTVMKYWPNLVPPKVTLNSPIDITDNSMTLTWTKSDIKDFHHYEVHISKVKDFTPTTSTRLKTILDQATTSYVVTGLSRDTTYYFRVRVVDNGALYADSNQVYGHTIIGKLPPAAVKLNDPTDITDSSMMLSWSQNKDTDFDHYELHMSKTKDFTPSGSTAKVTINNQTKTDTPVQGLTTETTYYFKLRTVDKDGLMNDSNQVSGTTQKVNAPPTAVTLNQPYNVTYYTMEVNWTMSKDSDFKKYEVHISTDQGFTISNSTRRSTITQKNLTWYKFENLNALTVYYIKVRVVDTGDLSDDSNEVSAKTKEFIAPPVAVTLNDPVNITETSMKVNWTKSNDTYFNRYEVHMATSAGFAPNQSTLVNKVSTRNVTTYKFTGLTPGTTYFIKIRVVDTVDQFADSNEVEGKTIGNAPPKAVILEVGEIQQTTVGLLWTTNNDTDFKQYEIYYSKDPAFTPDPASLFQTYKGANQRAITVDQLDMNTTYYFKVRVVDSLGAHSDSNRVNATTLGPDLPPKALVLGDPQNVTRTSMVLYWSLSPDRDFAAYEIHRSEKAGFKPSTSTAVVKISDINQTDFNASGLKMDTEYHFIVRVYDFANQFNDSNEVFATTKPPNQLPIADAGPALTAYVADQVELKGVGIDPDGKVVLYEWDLEGTGIYDYSNSLTGEVKHQYMKAGDYTPVLRVTDNEGATNTSMTTVSVNEPTPPDMPPKADAGPDQTVYVGDTVNFEGTGTDEDGTVVYYEWDFNADGTYESVSADDGIGTYVYNDPGTYKARLRVTDDAGLSATAITHITVTNRNHAPDARISKPVDGKKYINTDSVQFDGSSSSDQDGDLMTFKWIDESDGGKVLSTKAKFSMVLTKLGAHSITLDVSDGKDTGTASADITVQEPTNSPPTLSISDPGRGAVVKGTVTIDGRASDTDGSIDNVCIAIDGGACQAASGKSDWSYDWNTANVEAGLHTIKAVATDNRGGKTDTSITVTVEKKSSKGGGFLGLPGFEAPVMLAAAALVALAVAARKRRDE
jgi:hypothetical protein